MLEAQGRPGSASGLAGGAGVHEVRVKACLAGAHLGPMEEWKWAYMVWRSLPSGRKTAQMLSLEVVYVPGHIRPRDELRRFRHVRGRESGGRVLEMGFSFFSSQLCGERFALGSISKFKVSSEVKPFFKTRMVFRLK